MNNTKAARLPLSDQRTATDAQFLSQLSLPAPFGPQLKSAFSKGDIETCKQLVATHFRTRKSPRWPFYMHGSPWLELDNRGKVLEKAELLLKNRFRNHWPPNQVIDLNNKNNSGIDWNKAFRLIPGTLSRNAYLPDLTTAFALTGNTAYIKKAAELLRPFVKAHPFVLDPGFFEDSDRYFGSGCNSTMDVGYRAMRWIELMHCGALHVPGVFSDDDIFWLVKQLWFYAVQINRLKDEKLRRDNHHLCDHGLAPYVFGVMCPEFTLAKTLRRSAERVIRFHCDKNIYSDGTYAEHSTKYQYHHLPLYLVPLAISRANNLHLFTGEQLGRLTRWAEFTAFAGKPNGILSEFGDEYGCSLMYYFGLLTASVMSPRMRALAQAFGFVTGRLASESGHSLTAAYKNFKPGVPPLTGLSPYYTRKRRLGTPDKKHLPSPATVQFPKGGYTFFRSAWSKDADFLGVSHYTRSLPHCHTHWDFFSFILHTQGETLIGDPATRLYGPSNRYGGEVRGYLYNMLGHNCLIINNDPLKTLAATGHECFWGGYPHRCSLGLFKAGSGIEVMEAWYNAYKPLTHRRIFIHIRGIGFVFVDMIRNRNLDLHPHQFSQFFHAEDGVELKREKSGALWFAKDGARCCVVPGAEVTRYEWQAWRDERLKYNPRYKTTKLPYPYVAKLDRRIEGPAVFTTFLFTGGVQGMSKAPVARYLGKEPSEWRLTQHEGMSAHKVDLGKNGTLLLACCPYGKPLTSPEFSTNAELGVALLDGHGKLKCACMVRGSKMIIGNRKIAAGKYYEWEEF